MSAAPRYVLGLGACSATTIADAETLTARVLAEAGIGPEDLLAVATVDRRAGHPALDRLAAQLGHAVEAVPATVLRAEDARLDSPSERVRRKSGLRGIAEAAALAIAGPAGRLVVPKRVGRGITAALALVPPGGQQP